MAISFPLRQKMGFFFSSLLFVISINYAHEIYLNPIHEFWGFPYHQLSLGAWLLVCGALALTTVCLPLSLSKPSALVLFLLYVFTFMPTLIITLALGPDSLDVYGLSLIFFVLGFNLSCLISKNSRVSNEYKEFKIGKFAVSFFLFFWLVLAIYLVYSFHDVSNFAGLEDIYMQREIGHSRNPFEAYSQVYFDFVFSPALLVIGLIRKRFFLILLGISGFIFMYSITAERTIFLMPFAITALFFALRSKLPHYSLMIRFIIILSIVVVLAVHFSENTALGGLLSLYLVFRTIAVPGSMFGQYFDVFSNEGYTFWSNVSGIRFFIEAPHAYLSDKNWPQLGYIVADRILGVDSNSNANPFAYDGIAAAGNIGVLLIAFLLGVWLMALDWAAEKVDFRFSVPIVFPLAFALINGSLFSILLSFGGLFWIAYFRIHRNFP